MTTEDVANELGVTPRRVLALIYAGRLPAEQFGPVWMIRRQDLKHVRHRPPGRPNNQK